MPTLIDLLDQYLFSDAPGQVARTAVQRAWEYTTANSWDKLYLASLDDALSEELPHLSAYSGPGTARPSRPELANVLAAELGEAGTSITTLDQSSRTFVTELARAMQNLRLITINHHNLFTDEYRQILLNLFDHAHTRFKSVLLRSEPAYTAALATATDHDPILLASIAAYLARQFGVQLESLKSMPTPPKSAEAQVTLPTEPPTELPRQDSELIIENVVPPPPQDLITPAALTVELESLRAVETESTLLEMPEPIDSAHASFPENSIPSDAASEQEILLPLELPPSAPPPDILLPLEPAEAIVSDVGQPHSSELPATFQIQVEPPILSPEPPMPFAGATRFAASLDEQQSSPPEAFEFTANEDSPRTIPPPPPFGSFGAPPPKFAGTDIASGVNKQLRILIATPPDVQVERRLLTELVHEMDARARARFGVNLILVTPPPAVTSDYGAASPPSVIEQADVFVGVVWLQFGAEGVVEDGSTRYFAGTQRDFSLALEQGSARGDHWMRTVIYRSIRPPLDLLHLDVAEYGRVQTFFERAGAFAGDDVVRVYADSSELINDARARLDAWIYNYAGDLANTLSNYGNNSAANGQIREALNQYEQAIELYRELDRPEQELALWLRVGALEQSSNDVAAQEAFETAFRLARRIEDDSSAAFALRSLGAVEATRGDWHKALANYQQAYAYLQPGDDQYRALLQDRVDAHEALAEAEQARGAFDTAEKSYRDALDVAQELADSARIAGLWSKIGALAAERGQWHESVAAYDNALGNLRPTQQTEARRAIYDAQTRAHTELAQAAEAIGDAEIAEREYQAALRADTMGSNSRSRRVALFTSLGLLNASRREYDRSIEAQEQALALLDSPDDADARRALLAQQAAGYHELGSMRAARGEMNQANSAYRDSLALYQELGFTSEQGAVLAELGNVAMEQRDWQQANAYYVEALSRLDVASDIEPRNKILRAQAAALLEIGDEHREANEWTQAEIAYLQGRGNLEQLEASSETGGLLYRLGVVTAAQSRLPEALAYFQQARARLSPEKDAALRLDSLRAQSDALRRYADMYRGAGDYTSADAQYRQHLEIAEELNDPELEADAYHSLGLVAADRQEWDTAVDLYEQALARMQAPEQEAARTFVQRHQLAAYEKIGERERTEHNLAQAVLAYRSALTLAQALGDREQEADLLYVLGLASIEQENWQEALTNLRRSLGIYNLMPAAPNKPKVIFAIGRAQRGQKVAELHETMERGHSTRDDSAFAAAVILARELGDNKTASRASQQLGNLAAEQSDWDNALKHYEESLIGLRADEEPERLGEIQLAQLNARRERSLAHSRAQQWSQADADLFVALDLARQLDDVPTQGELVYRRGLVAAGQQRWNESIDLYSEALNRLPPAGSLRPTIEKAQAQSYTSLGDQEQALQNWEGAEAAYSQAYSLESALGEREPLTYLYRALGTIAAQQGRWNDAVTRYTAARDISEELGETERTAELETELELARREVKREQQQEFDRKGDSLRATRDYASARVEYLNALALSQELDNRAAQAELYAKLGFIDTETGMLADALENYRIAAGLYDAPENAAQRAALVELQAHALQELGNRAGSQAKWQDALGYYSQAVALLDGPTQQTHRNQVVQLQAVTLQNLGDQAREQGDTESALDSYRRAAGLYTIVDAIQDEHVVGEREGAVLAQLARDAHQAGDLETALRRFDQAIERLSQAQAPTTFRDTRAAQLLAVRDMGNARSDAGDHAGARREYRLALTIADELQDVPAQADLYHRLGKLAATQQDWDAALVSYQYALDRAEPDSEFARSISYDRLDAHRQRGTQLRIDGDLTASQNDLTSAYAISGQLGDNKRSGELAFLLGTLAADQKNWDDALAHYDTALAALSPDDPSRSDIQSYRAYALQEQGDNRRAAGQFEAASESYTTSLEIADELGDDTRGGHVLYRFGLLAAARGLWEPAIESYDRARARSSADSETTSLIERDNEIATLSLKRERLAAHLDRASIALNAQQYDDASSAYRSALLLSEDLGETELTGTIRQDLINLSANRANSYIAAGDWTQAEELSQQQLALGREFDNPKAQAEALYNLGVITGKQDHWLQAKAHYEQARPLLVNSEWTGLLTAVDDNLAAVNDLLERQRLQAANLQEAETAHSEGRFGDAAIAYRSSLRYAEGLDDTAAQITLRQALIVNATAQARMQAERQEWDAAQASYRNALALATEFQNREAAAARQSDLIALSVTRANAALEQRDWDSAEASYRNALTFATEFQNEEAITARQDELIALAVTRANDSLNAREWDSAEASYRNALAFATEFQNEEAITARQDELIALAVARANAALEQHDWDSAEASYRNALSLANEFQNQTAVAARQDELIALAVTRANAVLEERDWDGAQANYRHALTLANEFQNQAAATARQNDLIALSLAHATALEEQHDWTQARTVHQETFGLGQEFGKLSIQADALLRLGELDERDNNLRSAGSYYDAAARFYQQAGNADAAALATASQHRVEMILAREAELAAALAAAASARSLGQWTQAEHQYQLALANEMLDDPTRANAHLALGDIAAEQSAWEPARIEYGRASELYEKMEQPERVAELAAAQARMTRNLHIQERDAAFRHANLAFERGDWLQAEEQYQQGLGYAELLGDKPGVGAFQLALANTTAAQKRWDKAAELYNTAAETFAAVQDETQRTAARTQLLKTYRAWGDELVSRQNWQDAQGAYTNALTLAQLIAPSDQIAGLHSQLGLVTARQGNLRESLDHYDRALALVGQVIGSPERNAILEPASIVWTSLGDAENANGNLSAAQDAYEHALANVRELQDETRTADLLHNLALIRGKLGNQNASLDAHREALSLVKQQQPSTRRLGIITALAAAEYSAGALEPSREHYQTALTDAQITSNTQAIADIEFALGEIATKQTRWQDAITHYEGARAYTVAPEAQEHLAEINAREANANAELGELYYGEGQWSRAEQVLSRALALDELTRRTDRDGVLLYRRGSAAAAQENYPAAIADYERASAVISDDDPELQTRTLAQLAYVLQQEGKRAQDANDLETAVRVFNRARLMSEASGNPHQVADIEYRLGTIYRAQSKNDEALTAFRRAYDFDGRDGNPIQRQEISDALAGQLWVAGSAARQAQQSEYAQELFTETLNFVQQSNNPYLVGATLQELGELSQAQDDVPAAIDYFARAGQAFASVEDMDRWRGVSQQQAELLRLFASRQLDANEFADAENLYRRARLLQQATGDDSNLADIHLGLGRALLAQERYEDALTELTQADELFAQDAPERQALYVPYAEALEAYAAAASTSARPYDADRALAHAAELRDRLGQRTQAGLDWHQRAAIALELNALPDAIHANEQALARLDQPESADARREVLKQQAQILALTGDAQQKQGDLMGASETYRRALSIAQEQGAVKTLAELRLLLGSLAAAQERWSESRTEYLSALEVYQELEDPAAQAGTWVAMGDMHRQATQYDEAIDAYNQARDMYHQLGNRVQEGGMWLRIGHVRSDRADYDGALDEYQTALHLYNDIGARSEKPQVYRAFERAVRNAKLAAADQAAAAGDAKLEQAEWSEAEAAYREAYDLYQEAEEPVLQAQMQNQLGVALEAQNLWEEALAQYRKAFLGFDRVGIPEAKVSVLANIGDAQRQREMWIEAEAAYRQALALNQGVNDDPRAADLYSSLGAVRQAQDDWEGAQAHYAQAVLLYERAEMNEQKMQAQADLARAENGAREHARVELERNLAQAEATHNLAEAGEILNSLGLMAAEEQRWNDALDYYRRSVTTFEQVERETGTDPVWRTAQGTVLNNIGEASQQLGAWTDADYAYSRALNLAREIGDRESEALLLANLGVTAQAQDQLPRALDLNLQALRSYREIGDQTPRSELLERVGDLQFKLGQSEAAETTYREALTLARNANQGERVARLLKQMGLLAEGRGAEEQALNYYTEAVTLANELADAHEKQELWMKRGALHARNFDWEQADLAHQTALALAVEQDDKPAQAELHKRLGETAVASENWGTALREFQAALELHEKLENERDQAYDLTHIAQANIALGELGRADEAYTAALELGSRNTELDNRSLWLKRAEIAEKQNRWQDAAAHLGSALEIQTDSDPNTQIELLFRRGDAAMLAHAWNTADASYNDAMELANTSGNRLQYGWGMNRLGVLSQAQGQWNDALENFQEAIEVFRESEFPLGEAHVLNNIGRLKLETNDPSQADLFAQAALAIAQALSSNTEVSVSLYTRGLVLAQAQEFEAARRLLAQSVATDPANWFAQLQLGNVLTAAGDISGATLQAEAGLGQRPDWELGALAQLTIAALFEEDIRPYKANVKRTRAFLKTASDRRTVSQEYLQAVEWILQAMEGSAEQALTSLNAASEQAALPIALEARRFARAALLALSKSPRKFKNKQTLVTFFAPPVAQKSKNKKRRGGQHSSGSRSASSGEQDNQE